MAMKTLMQIKIHNIGVLLRIAFIWNESDHLTWVIYFTSRFDYSSPVKIKSKFKGSMLCVIADQVKIQGGDRSLPAGNWWNLSSPPTAVP
jgi:hypothetical protein